MHGIASQINASQGSAAHRTAMQSNINQQRKNMKSLKARITGIEPLLVNNPQQVDPFNKFAKASKSITSKRKKTDEDLLAIRDIEIESKLYFNDEMGLWVPATWIIASIASLSWTKSKIKKAEIRSCVFVNQSKIKVFYKGIEKVKTITDIVKNPEFHTLLNLKQGQVRIAKSAPIFHDWHFDFEIMFDDSVINGSDIKNLLEIGAKFGGFGDFRPTFGRAKIAFL